MAAFKWTERATKAALALAEGKTRAQVIRETAVPERTLYNWLANPDFGAEVDRLTLMTGIAGRAARLRIAKRLVEQKISEEAVQSDRDLLDWLKYAQSETDGIKLDLTTLLEALASMAGGGSPGSDSEPEEQ